MSQPARFPYLAMVSRRGEGGPIPLLLGQVNFFQEFAMSFHGARRQFELQPTEK
jgi:hypothetical protein